jgi:CheY-like chemotaxis protein
LLAFSRKQIMRMEVLDPGVLVAGLLRMLERLIGEDVEIRALIGSGQWRVLADRGQLEQAVVNLATNARDAMPRGGTLTIETGNADLDEEEIRTRGLEVEPGPYALLSVRDTGKGMDEETRRRIFDPFFTTKEVGRGTGLGLAMVYGIVKQSGGGIGVRSVVGEGSEFRIYLPRHDPPAVRDGGERAQGGGPAGGSETIFLAEDDAGVRDLLRMALRGLGYTVLDAGDGWEALEAMEGYPGPIHLLVTDVVMPGMSGRELAERIERSRPGMKVLFLSGHMEDAMLRHGVEATRVPFLQKPFDPDDLARKVREVLDSGP